MLGETGCLKRLAGVGLALCSLPASCWLRWMCPQYTAPTCLGKQFCLWAGVQALLCAHVQWQKAQQPQGWLGLWVVPAQLAELQGLVIRLHVQVSISTPCVLAASAQG